MSIPFEKSKALYLSMPGHGDPKGPYTESELSQWVHDKQLDPQATKVWHEGMADWVSVTQFLAARAGMVRDVPPPINGSGGFAASMAPDRVPHQASTPFPSPPHQAPSNLGSTYAEYAGFWRRYAAAFIDGIVGWGLQFPIYFMVPSAATVNPQQPFAVSGAGMLISVIIGWLYSALLESSSTQATLGKMALGLKVTDVNGQRIDFARASIRHFGKIVSFCTLCVGFLVMLFTSKRQTLHDIMSQCLVLKIRR